MKREYQKAVQHPTFIDPLQQALQLTLDPADLVRLLQTSVHTFGVEVGRAVAMKFLNDEVKRLCGRSHERFENRRGHRHGEQRGWITIGGQKLPVKRPRVRAEGEEVELDSYRLLQREDAMPEAVLERMVRGVSCRDYSGVVDLAVGSFGTKRSSVSRAFVEASRDAVQQLAERRFEGVRFPVNMIDGVDFCGATMVVVLGIQTDGLKQVLGFREGATENAEVCKMLLEELCERGLSRQDPTLFVIDGSKALRKSILDIWGRYAVIQRCQLHKKRNVQAHVPKRHWDEIRRRLNEAYHEQDYERALRLLKNTARLLDRISPDAANSLREGMEETLTLLRLGVSPELMVHVSSTNIIESSLDGVQRVSRNVKRWRGGDMRKRWCATGLIRAEKKFRRVKGHRYLPKLTAALDRVVQEKLIKTA